MAGEEPICLGKDKKPNTLLMTHFCAQVDRKVVLNFQIFLHPKLQNNFKSAQTFYIINGQLVVVEQHSVFLRFFMFLVVCDVLGWEDHLASILKLHSPNFRAWLAGFQANITKGPTNYVRRIYSNIMHWLIGWFETRNGPIYVFPEAHYETDVIFQQSNRPASHIYEKGK